ncbi:uncharacterized protein K02A2.6-like [Syngnathus typhle]|uniref:uncharacterized protein K02A2.6-like n=1 Tax=Syngnathus typhle TaxID=161592 RepID=UPI002A69F11D|nr:uncharacterized protein K02A2.6-like [Syngnathus typhle]
MCKSKYSNAKDKHNIRKGQKLHKVAQTDSDSSSEEELACLGLCATEENDGDVIWLTPKINGVPLKMELDTGSALSIISFNDYKKMFPDTKLSRTSVKLKTYTGEKVAPLGKLKVKVKYRNQKCNLELFVLKEGGVPLFGRRWLRQIKLNWHEIKSMHIASKQLTDMKLTEILDKHAHVFSEGIGTMKHIKARLELEEGAKAKFHKARPVPYALRPKVEAELQNLMDQGIVSKVDWSEWATPIVPVAKKSSDKVRICGDFKVTVNPVMHADQYPLPRIDDIFASLANGEHFTKIDLAQAYLQMEMDESSRKYLTINTHKGLYQYNRLVFGITSAPAIWQRAMDQVLQGIPGTQCYLDDIIVTGWDKESHLQNLNAVLTKLEEYGLKANKKKCEFFKESIEYCGHKIDKHGLHKTQDKIEAVVNSPQPENVTQLRSFLGLVNYYHKFLPNLSTVLHPLNALLHQKAKWDWTKDCEQAFTKAKELIISDKVLTHFDPKLPLCLACDASPYGIGAVLSHKMTDGSERPIAFASRSLSPAERNYAQIDREALSLVWGVKKFNQYLYGKHFMLITDHQPLVSIFSPKKGVPAMAAARLQRWALFLGAHTYTIDYKGTKLHGNADGLSRLPQPLTEKATDPALNLHMLQMEPLPVTCAQISKETRNDPLLSRVYDLTVNGWPMHADTELKDYFTRKDQLTVSQGCVLWGSRVVVPPKLRSKVLNSLHDGHMGVVKMKSLARSYVWWPGLDNQIETLVKTCRGCHQTQRSPQIAPVHTWEWPVAPWQRIHIDYAGPFMDHMFLIVVDAHSKWPEVFTVKKATTTVTVNQLQMLFARTGYPLQLVSDNGTQFTSEEFQIFLKSNGIKHLTSAPHHPATNGLAERFVQTFKQSMKASRREEVPLQQKIANFLLAYRNTPHTTTGQSPAMLFMGRNLRSRLDLLKPDIREHVSNRQCSPTQLQRKLRSFDIGQKVLARDYRNQGDKWQHAEILTQTGPLSYTVSVEPNVVWRRHVDQLLDASPGNAATQTTTPTVPQNPKDSTPASDITPEENMSTPEIMDIHKPMTNLPDPPGRRYPERVRKPPDRLDL